MSTSARAHTTLPIAGPQEPDREFAGECHLLDSPECSETCVPQHCISGAELGWPRHVTTGPDVRILNFKSGDCVVVADLVTPVV